MSHKLVFTTKYSSNYFQVFRQVSNSFTVWALLILVPLVVQVLHLRVYVTMFCDILFICDLETWYEHQCQIFEYLSMWVYYRFTFFILPWFEVCISREACILWIVPLMSVQKRERERVDYSISIISHHQYWSWVNINTFTANWLYMILL